MPPQTAPDEAKPPIIGTRQFVKTLIDPTINVGLATGALGLVGGGAVGLIYAPRPGPFAAAVAVQSFYYGASITFFRSSILAAISDNDTRSARMFASGTAGVASGLIAGTWQHVPTGRTAIIVGALGIATQAAYDTLYNRYSQKIEKKPFLERLANSSWMPLRSLPDDEYEDILQRRIDKLQVEISSVESQLNALQKQKARMSGTSSS